ncbi:caspase family protein [Dactylosporangium sp. NBC_01737]|uniref:caspase family protein n=1 Tax=Dactylosporangium sp. NBC_01737 TaxID=2975959 RepID=UPI002E0FD5F9|nr:caspase family protein [Dactylosporangium sp. NBC_01737]
MRRTALLIGAQTHGLTGVGNDVDVMARLLAGRGFAVTRCDGARATRAGILDAYERLIRDARPGDAVVVYYSGHGGLATPPPELAPRGRLAPPPRLQFIVPVDHTGAAGEDFRGITGPELSVLLVRLTNTTRNVTVVVDACHAAHVSRDDELRVKALPAPVYLDVAEHLSRLRRQGLDTAALHALGNQDAVRVVACGREQSAYEYTNDAGRRVGLFTESLALALAEAGDAPVTWAGLLPKVRDRVRAEVPFQRPEAEGPSLRAPFRPDPVEPGPGPQQAPERAALDARVTVGWGRVVDGRARPLPGQDAVVHAGDHVYVHVRNDDAATVHVSLLAFDVLGRSRVVTSLDPSGVAVRPGEEHVIGRDELHGRLDGIALGWPPEAGDAPRPAAFVVLVASGPEAPAEVYRDLAMPGGGEVRRDAHRIRFRLDPGPRSHH